MQHVDSDHGYGEYALLHVHRMNVRDENDHGHDDGGYDANVRDVRVHGDVNGYDVNVRDAHDHHAVTMHKRHSRLNLKSQC